MKVLNGLMARGVNTEGQRRQRVPRRIVVHGPITVATEMYFGQTICSLSLDHAENGYSQCLVRLKGIVTG